MVNSFVMAMDKLQITLFSLININKILACCYHTANVITKDAGFVYESLRIKTNRVIWDFCLHKMNPHKRIHDTNL
jgi:hypothetical protein